MSGRVVLGGSLAQKPFHGGHAWVFLQYLLGLRRLGWDVLFLDRLPRGTGRNAAGRPCGPDAAFNVPYFTRTMARFGLDGHAALHLDGEDPAWVGLSRAEVVERVRTADLFINVMGFIDAPEVLDAATRRVFLDIDPGFGQLWRDMDLADLFAGYDAHVTIGERIGQPDCTIPTCGLNWITTPQPVVLEEWPADIGPAEGTMTSIVSWRGAYGPLEHEGRRYGLRVHEFRRLASLPSRVPERFELALDIAPEDAADRAALEAQGWILRDPVEFAGDPLRYRESIRHSRGEFLVAKQIYVASNSGWFSDRSICYLASGRPVVAQDTGLTGRFSEGEGLLLYRNVDEAVAALETLREDYAAHCRAAREIAERHFDSDRVLARLLSLLEPSS